MLNKIPYFFLRPFPYWQKIDFFRKVLYVFLLANSISLLPIATELYGYNGIIGNTGWHTGVPWYQQGSKALINALSHPINSKYPWIVYVFVFGQLAVLITGLFNIWRRLSSVLIYFFTVNLFLRGYLMFTGGEVLINLLLFYLIFIQRSDKNNESKPQFSSLQNVLNNTFYLVLLLQVCVLYFFSNLYKLIDAHWVSGEALMYISRIDAFSGSLMKEIFSEQPFLSKIATYTVLIYQGLFPFVVWVKRVKIPFLVFGILLHLGIAFGMGIFTFGILMILTYLLFLNENQLNKIRGWLWLKPFNTYKIDIEN